MSVHPFVGCWTSDDGLSREGWTIDPSGWLFGYALDRDAEGEVVFHEQMRLERSTEKEVLVVTGMDGATTSFTREEMGASETYRFVNAEHDYPQVIEYYPTHDRLDAAIMTLDGENRRGFKKKACGT